MRSIGKASSDTINLTAASKMPVVSLGLTYQVDSGCAGTGSLKMECVVRPSLGRVASMPDEDVISIPFSFPTKDGP